MLCFSIQRTRKTLMIQHQATTLLRKTWKKHMFKQHDTISYKDLNIIGGSIILGLPNVQKE